MSHFARESEIKRLSDVDIPPEFYERIGTGSDPLDIVLGGEELPGIMPGTTWLFSGPPGGGKSTLMMQVLEHMAKELNLNCLYNSGEESIQRIAYRARRIGIDAGAFSVAGFENVGDLEEAVRKLGIEVLIVDSLQSLSDGEEIVSAHGLVKRFVNLSIDTGCTVFLIGHVTKSGAFAGKNSIEHDVDAHVNISINKDTGNRVIQMMKNRVGPSLIPYEFTMTGEGLDLRRLEPSEGDKGGARPTPASQEFLLTVKELLKNGEKLSGYSHDEFEQLSKFGRSGGFMRAMLSKATEDLKREGFLVMEETIAGRRHQYIDVPTANINDKEV